MNGVGEAMGGVEIGQRGRGGDWGVGLCYCPSMTYLLE